MTTEQARLGRLDRVDLREIWTSESADFTPWLAETDNLVILGDTIGLELELESQETKVGPFRADILCRDTGTNAWVLIENQLERTDHCHLGQLLTYAAGLKAVTVVWIAERFTEEHRAALDWLNEITDEKFAFFGLEIELWQIASSPVAPKFNVVCKPNDWSKTISEAAEGEITETKLLQQEYWASLRDLLLERKSIVKPQKPRPQHWTNFAVGRSFFGIHATVNTVKNWLQVGMSCTGPHGKAHFQILKQQKNAIETEIGCPLEWEELPGKKESRIALRKYGVDVADREKWLSQHAWLAEKLEAFHKAFAPRVKDLNAEGWQLSDDE